MALVERALTIVLVNFIFLGVSTIFFMLRCFVRISRTAFGLDDWLLLLGWLLFVVNIAFSTTSAYHGLGVRDSQAPVEGTLNAVKYFTLFQVFTLTGTLPVKASVCVSLLRITTNKLYKKIIYAIIAGSVVTILTADISVFATCRPMAFTWDHTIKGGKCSTIQVIIVLSYLFSAMNIITDWSTALLPAFIIRDLNQTMRVKLAICCLLGLGILASIATIVRMKYFPNYKATTNYLYGVAPIVWWSTIEIGLGISAASLSALRPLFTNFFGSTKGASHDNAPSDPQSSQRKGYMRSRAIRLQNIKDGLVTLTAIPGAGNSQESIPNEEDKLSQRRILGGRAENPHTNAITVTHSFHVNGEDGTPSMEGRKDDDVRWSHDQV